jgi:hypothetical protein
MPIDVIVATAVQMSKMELRDVLIAHEYASDVPRNQRTDPSKIVPLGFILVDRAVARYLERGDYKKDFSLRSTFRADARKLPWYFILCGRASANG